jgi:hypothetical protein
MQFAESTPKCKEARGNRAGLLRLSRENASEGNMARVLRHFISLQFGFSVLNFLVFTKEDFPMDNSEILEAIDEQIARLQQGACVARWWRT